MSAEIEGKIRQSMVNGKLPCVVVFKIAEELDVAPRNVKEVADELQIKISSCQLGCFP